MSEVIQFPPRVRIVQPPVPDVREALRTQTCSDAASRIEALAHVAFEYAPTPVAKHLASLIANAARAMARTADNHEPPPSAA